MHIGEAAHRLGVNPRTLRYYEGAGLLTVSQRTTGGFRVYSEHDLERVEFIRNAQKLGLHLGEIREIVAFRDRGQAPCCYVRELIERKRLEVDRRIRDLRQLKMTLERLAQQGAAIPAGSPEEQEGICHIIESQFAKKGTLA